MTKMRRVLLLLIFISTVLITSCDITSFMNFAWDKSNTSDSDAPELSSKITFVSGELNSTAISSADKSFTVAAGTYFMGTITVETLNGYDSSSTVQLGATNTWDDKPDAYWLEVLDISAGTNTYSIDVHETAPSGPGTYYLIIAFNEASDLSEVFSCTDSSVSASPVWNDGNDVADWGTTELTDAASYGAAEVDYLYSDGYSLIWLPALVIEIIVE